VEPTSFRVSRRAHAGGAASSPPQNMGARRQVTGSAWSGNPLSAARKIFLPTKYSYPQSEGFLAGKSGPAPPATGRKGWSPGKTSPPSPGIWGRKISLVGIFFGGNLLGGGEFTRGRRRRRRPGIFRPGSQNIPAPNFPANLCPGPPGDETRNARRSKTRQAGKGMEAGE
jgi:hypothetical protein